MEIAIIDKRSDELKKHLKYEDTREEMRRRMFNSLEQELINVLMHGEVRRTKGDLELIRVCRLILDDMEKLQTVSTRSFVDEYIKRQRITTMIDIDDHPYEEAADPAQRWAGRVGKDEKSSTQSERKEPLWERTKQWLKVKKRHKSR